MKRLFISLFLLTLFFVTAQAQEAEASITIDVSQELAEISPYVFGANQGAWAAINLDMLEYAANSGVTFWRFPGGRWGDQYDVTPQQVDLYIAQARMWNIEPSIHVRLEGGSPERVAELVRYVNIEKGYNVRYWAIGNEPTLFDGYDVDRFNQEWREFALAMEEVDPTILLVGPEVHQYADTYEPSYLDEMRHWVREFLLVNGDMVDVVTVHRYPFPLQMSGPQTTIEQMRENVPRWGTLVEILRADIQEVLGRDMPIAIMEANSHWSNGGGGVASPDSYYNSVWWSGVLTMLINSDVDIVSYWAFSTTGSFGAFGMMDRYEVRPTYHTYQMFRDFGQIRLVSSSSNEYVPVVAARREDGAITVMITNLYEEDYSTAFTVEGSSIAEVSELHLMSPEVTAEVVHAADYFDGTSLTIPAQSVIKLVFTLAD